MPTNAAEFWTMVAAIATILAFAVAAIYAWLTYGLFKLNRAMLEREDRPLLRLSAVNYSKPTTPVTVVNMGSGAAMTAAITKGEVLVLFLWTITGRERKELVDLKCDQGTEYSIYYQDIAGQWYLTRATPRTHRTENKFIGVVETKAVPNVVRVEAQVVSN